MALPFTQKILMVNITLPDGSVRSFPGAVKVADVAASIGAGLAKAAIAGKVDGQLVDTSFVLESDASLAIVTERDPEGLEIIRHSSAHLLAYAAQKLFPGLQVTIGHRTCRTVSTGIQHTDLVTQRLRGHAEHTAQLPAPEQAEPGAGRQRWYRPMQRFAHTRQAAGGSVMSRAACV